MGRFMCVDIAGESRARMLEYMERGRSLAPEARWARPEGLHVTLKFIGEVSEAKVQEIKAALVSVKAAPFAAKFEGAGFFPSPKSPRVFWIGVDGGPALSQLAGMIDHVTEKLGIAKEERAYSPHLTLARSASAPGGHHQLNPLPSWLQSEAPPGFGTMTAPEFFLHQSRPQRGGAKYTKLQPTSIEGN